MVELLIFSIVTGDSRILSPTLEAATTTSEPKTYVGLSVTFTLFDASTATSLDSKPTEVNTKV